MQRIIYALWLTSVCLMGTTSRQEAVPPGKEQAVIVPQEILLPVIVSQPDCPLQFEQALIIKYLDGSGGELYRVRNRGEKPIRSYTYAIWTSLNTGDINDWRPKDTFGMLMPRQTVSSPDKGEQIEFISLTDELRSKLKLYGPMKGAIIFMIVHIEFADGSVYEAKSKFKALKEYIKKLQLIEFTDDPTYDAEPKLRVLKEYLDGLSKN